MARLKKQYASNVLPKLTEEFAYKSKMEVPLIKITLNMGVGEAVTNKKVIESAVNDMMLIAGQKPVVTLAKKSHAGFKIRDGCMSF